MTLTNSGLRLATAVVLVGIVLTACGGRFRADDGTDTGSEVSTVSTAVPPADGATPDTAVEPPASVPLDPTASPMPVSGTPKPAASPAGAAATPAPVPTPDLDALDQLIDQLDVALAADAAADANEGSPQ